MSLHGLQSVTMGVPNVAQTAAYYRDFGLVPGPDNWFSTADGGRQLHIVHAPTRRLTELRVGADDADDLELGCSVNGEQMQKSRTRDLIVGVPGLIEQLSRVTPLLPGDLIFTGTPSGVGSGRNPQRWLAPGDVLTTYIEGIGEMRHTFVAASAG